ncbi:MAG TPA: hypothetical protein VGH69_20060 [Mycobacterium sp.]
MTRDIVKGAVVGAIAASIVLLAGSAVAGTGIGGVFNLGRTNTVNAKTTLMGSTSAAQLAVSNAGSGPALKLSARAGHAPLSVSNKVMIPRLNANYVGGHKASSFVSKCQRGSVAAVASFYAPAIPSDPTYVTPNRYGGEGGFACNRAQLELTKEGTGWFRLKFTTSPANANSYLLFVNPDARGSTPLYGDGNSAFAGPSWDIHVFDKTGAPADPYYLDVQLISF